jgi:hypothetical protein
MAYPCFFTAFVLLENYLLVQLQGDYEASLLFNMMSHCHISLWRSVGVLVQCFLANGVDVWYLFHGPSVP